MYLCFRILQGNPKPSISWSFKSATMSTSNVMAETTETVHLKNVRKDQTGTYECSALNTQGSDSFAMKLVVECKYLKKIRMKLRNSTLKLISFGNCTHTRGLEHSHSYINIISF